MEVSAIKYGAVTRAATAASAKPAAADSAAQQPPPARNLFAKAPRPRIMPFRLPENNVDVRQFLSMTALTISSMQSYSPQLDVTV